VEYALFGLLSLAGVITIRAIYLMTGIIVETGILKKEKEGSMEKVRNFAIEAIVLIILLMTILAVVFLFAHEGVM